MATLKTTFIQHPDSLVPQISLSASGMTFSASAMDLVGGFEFGEGITISGSAIATEDFVQEYVEDSISPIQSDLDLKSPSASPTFTGQVVVPSGTASAPSISPSGDTNTGLFFPAADTLALSSNGTERMRINSSGHVTMPNKPMFMGLPTTDYSGGGMPTGVIAFTALYNNGSHYNAANSRFTCPVTGWYRVTWGGLQLSSAVTSLMVNGSRTYNGNHYSGTAPAYITMTQTVVRSFAANDFLQIEGWNGGGYYNGWYLWTVEQIA